MEVQVPRLDRIRIATARYKSDKAACEIRGFVACQIQKRAWDIFPKRQQAQKT